MSAKKCSGFCPPSTPPPPAFSASGHFAHILLVLWPSERMGVYEGAKIIFKEMRIILLFILCQIYLEDKYKDQGGVEILTPSE